MYVDALKLYYLDKYGQNECDKDMNVDVFYSSDNNKICACKNKYFMDNGYCVACRQECMTCNEWDSCLTCDSDYGM